MLTFRKNIIIIKIENSENSAEGTVLIQKVKLNTEIVTICISSLNRISPRNNGKKRFDFILK
jgi:hypothetical protein